MPKQPVTLVRNTQLHAKLREHAIDDLAQDNTMYLEPDGEISVLASDADNPPPLRQCR